MLSDLPNQGGLLCSRLLQFNLVSKLGFEVVKPLLSLVLVDLVTLPHLARLTQEVV